jgi:site-specific DNA recombinase
MVARNGGRMSAVGLRLGGVPRISSPGQTGLPDQRRKIEEFAERIGAVIVKFYEDVRTGTTSNREGLTAALTAILRKQLDGIVVSDLGRLHRDMEGLLVMLGHVHALGGRVFDANTGQEWAPERRLDNPVDALNLGVQAAIAAMTRRQTVDTFAAGKARARANGRTWLGGRAPYGWRSFKGELVEVPQQQMVLALIRQMREEGMSLRAIRDRLSADQVPTATGIGRWNIGTLAKILDPAYYGPLQREYHKRAKARAGELSLAARRARAVAYLEENGHDVGDLAEVG